MKARRRLLPALLASTLLYGCSDEDPAVTAGSEPVTSDTPVAGKALPVPLKDDNPVVVLDKFGVGETVYVRSLAIEADRDALWVGTSAGVHEVDLKSESLRNTFTRDDGLANEYVFSIGLDHEGYKWFGTNAGGVSRYRDGDWKTFFPMHGLADYWVYSFGSQKDGSLWIGTWAGANRVDPVSGEFTTYVEELVNEWVYAIGVDSKDRVWFGTEGGVSLYDGESWREWTHADGISASNTSNLPVSANTGLGTRRRHDLGILSGGLPSYNPDYVFSLHIDPDDTVWIGTWGGGVGRYDGEKWTTLTTRDGLAGNIVYAIARTPDGAYWFGTNRGLSRFDGTTWQTFSRRDGLPQNDVYTLVVDPDGSIWAGTRGGVTHLGRASR